MSSIRWIDRARLDEPVVTHLDTCVLVENACVASNVGGTRAQERNIFDLTAIHGSEGESWNPIMH
jgi:hypothetical protein